jgi:transcriptional activator protein UGA3
VVPLSPVSPVTQDVLLRHYKQSLSHLVSCAGEESPNSFDAFTTIANASINSPAGQGLHFSILAWAGRHMVNQGQHKFEAISERLGLQASQILLDVSGKNMGEIQEPMTVFAGLLMLIQFKVSMSGRDMVRYEL